MAASMPARARQDQMRMLSAAVSRRTGVEVAAFAATYVAATILLSVLLGSLWSNVLSGVLQAYAPSYAYQLRSSLVALFALLVVAGFIAGIALVVRRGINRALAYFDLLLDSVSDILAKREGPIALPDELSPTAAALNVVKAESERNERAAKAAEERKNELVVYLAHDIKTPLTSIIGYLTLLDESPDLPAEARARYAGITLEKAYRLEELLDEFFEITRYNLQAIPIERSRFDGALFAEQVVGEFYPLAEARGLRIVLDAPDELPVFADAGRVARVLNNVLKNAVAYADPGTDVVVRTSLATAADGFVWWELAVVDHGRELSPQHLERIFEKFFRADGARSTTVGGAGLGLAIAREIARAHGGDIYAASDAGTTSFTVWIPQGPRVGSER